MIFLFDTNIIIKLWNENPVILDALDKYKDVDYKVTNETVMELANGDINEFFPKVSSKYQQLLNHMVQNDAYHGDSTWRENRFLFEKNGQVFYTVGNKISSVDYGIVSMCQNYNFVLVTNDKKILKSARLVLPRDQVIDYYEFIVLTNKLVVGE